MGTRGPLPVSWSSETARGRNTFQPAPAPEANVSPPAWLDEDALRFWDATAPTLIAAGRLRSSMGTAFAILCELAADCTAFNGGRGGGRRDRIAEGGEAESQGPASPGRPQGFPRVLAGLRSRPGFFLSYACPAAGRGRA